MLAYPNSDIGVIQTRLLVMLVYIKIKTIKFIFIALPVSLEYRTQ